MPEKMDCDFEIGEICLYYEEGAQLRCEILHRSLEGKRLYLTLKVVGVIREALPMFSEFNKIGFVFEVWKDAAVKYFPGLWYLKEVTPQNLNSLN
jgi:hypothetical protein